MTKSELKQKLEAVRDAKMEEYHGRERGNWGNDYAAGADLFLPLLLDAYEALGHYKDITIELEVKTFDPYIESVCAEVNLAETIIARIEAFANGKK